MLPVVKLLALTPKANMPVGSPFEKETALSAEPVARQTLAFLRIMVSPTGSLFTYAVEQLHHRGILIFGYYLLSHTQAE